MTHEGLWDVAPMHVIAMLQIVTRPMKVSYGGRCYIGDDLVGDDLVTELQTMGMLDGIEIETQSIRATKCGEKWVAMICQTPFPVNRWIDPREEDK